MRLGNYSPLSVLNLALLSVWSGGLNCAQWLFHAMKQGVAKLCCVYVFDMSSSPICQQVLYLSCVLWL